MDVQKPGKFMLFYKYIFTILIISSVCLPGCCIKSIPGKTDNMNNNYITITGIAEETKDGYYVSGYVLVHEEIQKYYGTSSRKAFRNKKLEITGMIKTVNPECPKYDQCRKGPYKVIYDLKSVKIIE